MLDALDQELVAWALLVILCVAVSILCTIHSSLSPRTKHAIMVYLPTEKLFYRNCMHCTTIKLLWDKISWAWSTRSLVLRLDSVLMHFCIIMAKVCQSHAHYYVHACKSARSLMGGIEGGGVHPMFISESEYKRTWLPSGEVLELMANMLGV